MSKSYVTCVTNYCPFCGGEFDTGELLMDTTMRDTFNMHTCIDVNLCPEHQAKVDSGEWRAFLVIAERDCGACEKRGSCAPELRKMCDGHHYNQNGKYYRRTGQGFMLHIDAARALLKGKFDSPIVHCDQAVMDHFERLVESNTEGE